MDSIADVIRYTVILEPKEYVEQIRSVTDALYEKNWKIYSLKNYWVNDSFPYNGVNAKFKKSHATIVLKSNSILRKALM